MFHPDGRANSLDLSAFVIQLLCCQPHIKHDLLDDVYSQGENDNLTHFVIILATWFIHFICGAAMRISRDFYCTLNSLLRKREPFAFNPEMFAH